jgi:Fn3 associated
MKLKILVVILFINITCLWNVFAFDGIIIPSTESGIYNNDIELSFDNSLDIDLFYYFKDSLDTSVVRYQYPLSLTAMYGELKNYNIVIIAMDGNDILETNNLQYTIDKDIPSPAVLDARDGIYGSALNLKFKESPDSIYYSIQSENNNKYKLWTGEIITISQKDDLNTDFVKSYNVDSAGNISIETVNSFTILPNKKIKNTLNVISPVEGTFLNSQLLYLDTRAYRWIRYSFNDLDPAIKGTTYISPILLKTLGSYKLRIAALPFGSDEILRKVINFSIIDNNNIIINNESGIYVEELNLKFNQKLLNYNFDDRKVLSSDPLLPNYFSIMPVPGVIKYRTIRISDLADVGEYRYLFVLDKKIPAAPIISISSNIPVSSSTEVRILSAPGAEIYYSLDGSTPDRYSNYYNKPFNMEIPKGLDSGSMLIKAVSYFSDKSTSLVTSKLLTFDIKKPEPPVVTIIARESNHTTFNISNNNFNKIIYTVEYDGSLPSSPDSNSFTGSDLMRLSVPQGIESKVKINIAFIDSAGNISDSVIVDLLETDTVPPSAPNILFENGQLTIEGTADLYYKIFNNNIPLNMEFQLYNKPVLLDSFSEVLNKISIRTYSIDKKGNKSNTVIFNNMQIIDNRIPVFPDYSGIIDGGIYNQPKSIRFHSSDNINVYYTISQGVSEPGEPVPSENNLVNDFLYFDCPVNESRNYKVIFVAAYGQDKLISGPEQISFTIDRIAPRAPVISSVVDGKIYKDDLKISVNDKEETVWILIKESIVEEDLNYNNFEMNGILLNSDYILKHPDNTERDYQLAALAIDSAGNTNISREIISFTIDKASPRAPEIKEELSAENKILIRMIGDNSDEILYEINTDGSYPGIPDRDSNNYLLPLEFQKISNTPVFISARTIDSAGNLSIDTSLYKIIFNNSEILSPVISIGKISSTINNVSFASISGGKIFLKQGSEEFLEYTIPLQIDLRDRDYLDLFYYSTDGNSTKSPVAVYRLEKISSSGSIITGISPGKIYNSGRVVWKSNQERTVRYEVAIDDNEPDSVTVFSPELTDPIIFDSAEGETLKVSLNVKEFFEDLPVIEKNDINYKFIIDKTRPSSPRVSGVNTGGYYQDDIHVEFISDDSVFYKITSDTDSLDSLNYQKYMDIVEIISPEGSYRKYKIESYSEDNAGNRSTFNVIEFVIDKANIYVSINGKDSNNGSRLHPFKTIKRAIEYTKQTERKVINLTEGEFLIDDSVNLNGIITLTGGYTTGTWSSGRGDTVLSISRRFPVHLSMLNIESGNIVLKNITLTNKDLIEPIINLSGGQLKLNRVKLLHENKNTEVTIHSENSDLTFNDSELIFNSLNNGQLIESKKSNLYFENSIIKGLGISNILRVFSLDKSKISIINTEIIPSIAQKIEIINAINSEVSIKNTNLDTGFGTINSNLFLLKNSKFNMNNSTLSSVSASRILSCFDVLDSTISIDNSQFTLKADSGLSFIRIVDSSLELSNTSIVAETTDEFIYLLNGKTSIINLDKNKITTGNTDILTAFALSNSVSVFRNNVINFEGGTTVFEAFNFLSPLSVDFVSNKIFSKNISWISSEDQAAFAIRGGKDTVIFKGNNILGWKSVLNYNSTYIKTAEELNNFRGFLDRPEGNYSKDE